MKKIMKALAALMLMAVVVCAAGCKKDNIGTYNGHDYVDFGLPSGTLWATCNVGATTPEGYGDHFAWGETHPKDIYSWDTYQWFNGIWLTKYTDDDGLTTLQPSDDAATANWGEGWCMPTADQWRELINNTNVAWTTQNGVNGRLFTASNGNSLFLPAAGFRQDDELIDADSKSWYWSSSLYTHYPQHRAWSSVGNGVELIYRHYGQSVRAVRSDNSIYVIYVDLGLPSGTLWATCNVGATTPEGYGDYFAWGETEPKDTYDWSTYKYANGTTWENPQLTKYCYNSSYGYNGFTDNLTVLQPGDDAATANWGDDWRMPTYDQWQELFQYTTTAWTTRNGVDGWLFTASNGNRLFLPAAGFRSGDDLYSAGVGIFYWTSSLDMGRPYCAWSSESDLQRWIGHSVRAVRSARQD